MDYRQLGCSGVRVSAVGLGGNNFGRACDQTQSAAVIHQALDLGVNFVDTADVYGETLSEVFVGKAIAARRDQVVLATKGGVPLGPGPNDGGLSYRRVIASCEASLRRLGTDYIDLYYLHTPDGQTPLEETVRAFDALQRQGKIRYMGISNHAAWQICETLWIADRRGYPAPVVTQNRYNVIDRSVESELLPLCRAHRLGIVPYSPLASGILTGKYRSLEEPPPGTRMYEAMRAPQANRFHLQFMNQRNVELAAKLTEVARRFGHTAGELAIAWLLSHPEVPSVIAGATKAEQVRANVAAAEWQLSPDELNAVEEALAG